MSVHKQKEMNMQELMNRFREPSSYAALSAVFAMLGIMIPNDLWQSVVLL